MMEHVHELELCARFAELSLAYYQAMLSMHRPTSASVNAPNMYDDKGQSGSSGGPPSDQDERVRVMFDRMMRGNTVVQSGVNSVGRGFSCSVCDKKYTTQASLGCHYRTIQAPSRVKRLKCVKCRRAFVRLINAKHHQWVCMKTISP
jgi:hypothetical protein